MKTEEMIKGGHDHADPKPLRVTQWHDPRSAAIGWLVIDCWVEGVAGGGVFMSGEATAEETADIARTMSKKFAICPSPIGGAKAGIRCDMTDPGQRDAVLRRFLWAMRSELASWVTAGDYGTSDSVIERVVRDLTDRDMQWALYRRAAGDENRAIELSRRAADLYRIDMSAALLPPGMPRPEFDVSLIEAAVGHGIVESILAVFTKLDPRRLVLERSLEGIRIAVQGAGAVGTGVILYASRLGAKIVAISDADGIIYDPQGLDVENLLTLRAHAIASLAEDARPQARKLLIRYALGGADRRARVVTNPQVDAETRDAAAGLDSKLAHILKSASSVNVFVPAASRYLWNTAATEIASLGMWRGVSARVMVAGANNPFGAKNGSGSLAPATNADIDLILEGMRESKVISVPDFRANGGTAQLFHCYASGELDWILEGAPAGIPALTAEKQQLALQIISSRIRRAVNEDLEMCSPSLLDLPICAEERVRVRLRDLAFNLP
jgi:Glutamate/Leucine/Phenylalanine/Valine dehydrogenase/Glu/Leu/Phe/Val dehydrogenase, dimerisation domain